MSKQEERREDTGENSTDKILEEIEQDKKNIKKSSALAFAALIAIIALCIAWFVSNTRVTGTSVSVSADDNNPFMLASVGERTYAEKNYLKDETKNNFLFDGSSKEYGKYIDIKSGDPISEKQTYYTGTSSLAWRLNGQNSFAPGSSGKLEFYLIPKISGLSSAKISLSATGYTMLEGGSRAIKVTNEKVQNLINGHVLLFQNLDDTYGYTGWLGESPALTINAPNNGSFEKDIPYKVTIYWVWPRYFRNYIYTQRSTQEDLFTDKISQDTDSEYAKIIGFVNEQKNIVSNESKLFYSESTDEQQITEEINNQMSDVTLDKCNQYYNKADEYIGKNAKYVYVEMKVE